MKLVLLLLMLSVIANAQKVPETVFVPGGTFTQGTSVTPVETKEVEVNSFNIGKYEVTLEEYRDFCLATGHTMPEGSTDLLDAEEWQNYLPYGFDEVRVRYEAVQNVGWEDAVAYCKWLSTVTKKVYRLPTEDEWEFAARGGNTSKGFRYSGSGSLAEVGWSLNTMPKDTVMVDFNSPVYEVTMRVSAMQTGLLQPNELGLHDMSGNVAEWCSASGEHASTGTETITNSSGQLSYVLRGGSAWDYDVMCETQTIPKTSVTTSHSGFRVLLEN